MSLSDLPEPPPGGLCFDTTDPELFFPAGGENPHAAIAICRECSVRDECLERALHFSLIGSPVSGVWGATSEQQRRKLLRGKPRLCPDCETPVQVKPGRPTRRCTDCRAVAHARYRKGAA